MKNSMQAVAREDQEQALLFEWAALREGRWPELRLMYHVPNEGKRGMAAAMQQKRMGLKSGVPDICLPVARGGYHGLYIELKRARGGRLTQPQRAWLAALAGQGYRAIRCDGWSEAAQAIERYLCERDEQAKRTGDDQNAQGKARYTAGAR